MVFWTGAVRANHRKINLEASSRSAPKSLTLPLKTYRGIYTANHVARCETIAPGCEHCLCQVGVATKRASADMQSGPHSLEAVKHQEENQPSNNTNEKPETNKNSKNIINTRVYHYIYLPPTERGATNILLGSGDSEFSN